MTTQTGTIAAAVQRLHDLEQARTWPEPFIVELAGAPVLAYLQDVLARLTDHRRRTALLSPAEWGHAVVVAESVMGERVTGGHRVAFLLQAAEKLQAARNDGGPDFRLRLPGNGIQDFLVDVHNRQIGDVRAASPTRFECQHAAAIGGALG
uniref:hypothetical protein n=1 Tax=Nonomuraea sp. CA-251285 TaxID=3240002 RepID=UPI003F497B71